MGSLRREMMARRPMRLKDHLTKAETHYGFGVFWLFNERRPTVADPAGLHRGFIRLQFWKWQKTFFISGAA